MSVEVVMPQMGGAVTTGTVSKWLKSVGDKIEKDEPLLEISTDTFDVEVPAPDAGVLLEIKAQKGETVEVGTVVAVIGEESERGVSSQRAAGSGQEEAPKAAESATPIISETRAASSERAAEVVMLQLGESITEVTVVKWLKAVGETIKKDEPLLEVSTDKIDIDVPSPSAGTLLEIRVREGETVEAGAVVGWVGAEGAATIQGPPSKVQGQPDAEPPSAVPSSRRGGGEPGT